MKKLSIRDLDLKSNRTFIRVDFNVPLDEEGRITDETRIQASLPTLKYAIENQSRLILASHLGRPKGRVNPRLSLKPVAEALARALNHKVIMAPDCVGEAVLAQTRSLKDGDVLLLENLRFHPQEEANEPEFAKQLAALPDLYVNDAFATAHRAHASTVGMIPYVNKAAAGLLMEKELAYLGKAISNPDRPYVAILGGAKVSDKIEVIENLLKLVDVLLIGGGMAYTFLQAEEFEVNLTEDGRERIKYRIIDTIGIGCTTFTSQGVLYRLAEVSELINNEGINQIFLVAGGGRFTREEVEVYNLLRQAIFDNQVCRLHHSMTSPDCYQRQNRLFRCRRQNNGGWLLHGRSRGAVMV